jgi:NAD(P)-dependent dehydrogenase (short-subunit alcohol dehydrogenase family)
MDLELTGKTALVTGSHRGTGLIIARHLLREGVRVLVHGFEQDPATSAADGLGGLERGALPVWGDITTDEGTAGLLEQLETFEIDLLINNYGTAEGGSWLSSETLDWIQSYQHNVLSAQRLIRALLPGMQERGFGRVINLGTVGSPHRASRCRTTTQPRVLSQL